MYTKDQEIAGLEHRLEAAKYAVAHAEDVRKLMGNPLFRKVILEQFCVRDCARYVQESGDPLLADNNRADALALAQASGHLRRWLDLAIRMGDTEAAVAIDVQEELEVIRTTEADEE